MPINPDLALGQEYTAGRSSWRRQDIIMYNLAVGAGSPFEDEGELAYAGVRGLKILPTFAALCASGDIVHRMARLPGIEIDIGRCVHGEQIIELAGPIPPQADVVNTVRVANIYDKGKGGLVDLEVTTRDAKGKVLFVNHRSVFVRGEGGFGGDPGPKPVNEAPARAPDAVLETPILPQQALLYAIPSGEDDPLHTDPDYARKVGFEHPIMHGLCTYAMVCKAAIDRALDGDVSRVQGFRARFTGPVFPGETLLTRLWREEGRIVLHTETRERKSPALANAALTLRG